MSRSFLAILLVACTEETGTKTGEATDTTPDTAIGEPPDGEVTPERLAARGDCPAATGPGTEHTQWITADETWTAADSPHIVSNNLRLTATLTLEPCAVVLLGPGVYFEVGSATEFGQLIAAGSAPTGDDEQIDLQPVLFDALDPSDGWAQISVGASGRIDLTLAALLHGGHTLSSVPGALLLGGLAGGTNVSEVVRNARVDQVLVSDAAGYAVNLYGLGGFVEGSQRLWIRSSGLGGEPSPMRIEAGVGATLPAELSIEGNVVDEILVDAKTWMPDDTWANHGVPYHVRSALVVAPAADGPPATLTLEPGVTLAFEDLVGSGLVIGSSDQRQGVLVAEGTEAEPVVFTSASPSPAPGDWQGLYFRYFPTSGPRIAHAAISFAGAWSGHTGFGCGPGSNDAAVIIEGQGPDDVGPDEVFITSTTFDQIAGTTVIVSGWTDDTGPDFSADNTFGAGTPECKVSRPSRTGPGDTCDGGRDVCWD